MAVPGGTDKPVVGVQVKIVTGELHAAALLAIPEVVSVYRVFTGTGSLLGCLAAYLSQVMSHHNKCTI